MIRIAAYEDAALFERFKGQWRELLDNSASDHIFLTAEWQMTWWQVNEPGQLWVLAAQDDQSGQWVGLAPWYIGHEDGMNVVRTVGCEDVTDYLDIITRRGHAQEVFEALVSFLAAHRDRFDEVRLCNIPDHSEALTMLPAVAPQQGFEVSIREQEVCPVIVLPTQFEDFLASLDKKNRHELRRKLRRAGGLADWYIVGPEHDLVAEMQRFLDLMAASSPEKAAFLEERGNRRFFEAIIPVLAERGWLQLAFLTVGGAPAAAYLNFTYGNRVLVYNSGHNPADHGQLSPGIVLIARLIEHAISEGRDAFDFLRGKEPYKYDMGGKDTRVWELRLVPGAH